MNVLKWAATIGFWWVLLSSVAAVAWYRVPRPRKPHPQTGLRLVPDDAQRAGEQR